MRIALIHELLTMRGGAERMLSVVSQLIPEAPIYTLLYDEKKFGEWFTRDRVCCSNLQQLARLSTNHHFYHRLFPKAVEAWDFSDYDLVISFSSAFVHGIRITGNTKHLSYIHSPARYLWDQTFDVLERMPLRTMKQWYVWFTFHKLRLWDSIASERGDMLLAPSEAVKRRIELYWRRKSTVLFPPVDIERFPLSSEPRGEYYVIASSLVAYKRIELAIEACNMLGRHLKIIGEGPHRKALERIAGSSIEFLGYRKHEELLPILQKARGFIFPGEEDFGIAPIEAMSCGTPVIAYGAGGALETVTDGMTGLFFIEASVASLSESIRRFESMQWNPEVCHEHAKNYSKERFTDGLMKAVNELTPYAFETNMPPTTMQREPMRS